MKDLINKHWTDGGTGLTNTSPYSKWEIEHLGFDGHAAIVLALEQFPKEKGMVLHDKSLDDIPLSCQQSLHCLADSMQPTCSEFWALYSQIVEAMKTQNQFYESDH